MEILGYFLAIFIGIVLGLIGSGGSIIALPVLVYIMNIEPVLASAYSLFIVGITASIGFFQKAKENLVAYDKVIIFGIPTIISVFLTRKFILPSIPNIIYLNTDYKLNKSVLLMLFFAVIMFFSALKMIRPINSNLFQKVQKQQLFKIILTGFFIGNVAGFVGAGGGFLIIPALIFLTKTPLKVAVGTSLLIISLQSIIGFFGDVSNRQDMDWNLLLLFTACSISGVFIGSFLSKKIDGESLKKGFGYFVLIISIIILFSNFMK